MPSCFKKGKVAGMKAAVCRYNMPRDPCDATHVHDDDTSDDDDAASNEGEKNLLSAEVERKRTLASLYMNAANLHIYSLTKSNNDLRILSGISVNYSVKYTSKPQCIDADKVLKAALKAVSRMYKNRAIAEAREPHLTAESIGASRVKSLLFNITNFMQIDGTMAGYCLATGNRPFISSHRIVNLNLRAIIKSSQGEEHHVTLREDNESGFTGSNKMLQKYLNRVGALLGLSLFDFAVNNLHEKKSKKQAAKSDDAETLDEAQEDECLDDLVDFIGPATSPTDHVVCIHGFSFKPKERRTTTEKKEEYALGALLLFVPFSAESFSSDGLKNGHASYSEALQTARATPGLFSLRGTLYLQNVESMWVNKFKAQRKTKRHRAMVKLQAENDDELTKALRDSAAARRADRGGEYSDDDDKIESDFGSEDDSDDLFDFIDSTPGATAGQLSVHNNEHQNTYITSKNTILHTIQNHRKICRPCSFVTRSLLNRHLSTISRSSVKRYALRPVLGTFHKGLKARRRR